MKFIIFFNIKKMNNVKYKENFQTENEIITCSSCDKFFIKFEETVNNILKTKFLNGTGIPYLPNHCGLFISEANIELFFRYNHNCIELKTGGGMHHIKWILFRSKNFKLFLIRFYEKDEIFISHALEITETYIRSNVNII